MFLKKRGMKKRKRGGLIYLSALCENRKPEVFSGYGSETLVEDGFRQKICKVNVEPKEV